MQHVTLRPAFPQDAGFLYRLHKAALRDYVELTYGPWDEAWQRRRFLRSLNPDECQVIAFQGQDVGVVRTVERETEVFLSVIEILPPFQGKGIGTYVIRWVLDDAHRRGRPVVLQVFKVNPARGLYSRLGFVTVGETATHYQMRALPPEPKTPRGEDQHGQPLRGSRRSTGPSG
jgi:ribosomal protein S18 acetylase RimI-like enzyme